MVSEIRLLYIFQPCLGLSISVSIVCPPHIRISATMYIMKKIGTKDWWEKRFLFPTLSLNRLLLGLFYRIPQEILKRLFCPPIIACEYSAAPCSGAFSSSNCVSRANFKWLFQQCSGMNRCGPSMRLCNHTVFCVLRARVGGSSYRPKWRCKQSFIVDNFFRFSS
jgi:hypothetical protein